MLVFNSSHSGEHPLTCGIGMQHGGSCGPVLHCMRFGFFGPQRHPLLPPHSQTLSGVASGFLFFFWTCPQERVLPSGYTNARSGRDKGMDGLRDVFLGACLHHVASASLSNTGGYGQLMVNYYITSPHHFPQLLFFSFFFLRFLDIISSHYDHDYC